MKVKSLPKTICPKERLLMFNAKNLSDYELLSILIDVGNKKENVIQLSQRFIEKYGDFSQFYSYSEEEILGNNILGKSKTIQLLAVIEISKRLNKNPPYKDTPKIVTAAQVYELLKPDLVGKSREHLYLVTLNSRNKLISIDLISIGTIDETLFHPREIFRQILLRNATSFILAHNHPSNDASPSKADLFLTNQIISLSKLMNISFLDHIIVCDSSFLSLKSNGYFLKGGENDEK